MFTTSLARNLPLKNSKLVKLWQNYGREFVAYFCGPPWILGHRENLHVQVVRRDTLLEISSQYVIYLALANTDNKNIERARTAGQPCRITALTEAHLRQLRSLARSSVFSNFIFFTFSLDFVFLLPPRILWRYVFALSARRWVCPTQASLSGRLPSTSSFLIFWHFYFQFQLVGRQEEHPAWKKWVMKC